MSWVKGNKKDGRHYWITPPKIYAALNEEFHFDYDPCPFPLPDGYNGLAAEWGLRNYVNPPFGKCYDEHGKKAGLLAWSRKAIQEYKKGKLVVMVALAYKWELQLMVELSAGRIRDLGNVKWLATEDSLPGRGAGLTAAFILIPEVFAKDIVPTAIDANIHIPAQQKIVF